MNSKSAGSTSDTPLHSKSQQKNKLQAAALKYDGQKAPTLVAKGSGELAKRIIAKAEENNIHIHQDPILIDVLARLELGDEIPPSLYLAVAKIIAFAYFLQGKHPDNYHSTDQHSNLSIEQSVSDDKAIDLTQKNTSAKND
ncbi:EscU/YscU/HrcU family type III secretion system export apparatus switch protein [Aliikangiella maris]|uniref:Flagellar biosynthetic protein FlhB n=2 Tax=Aliikangiella maris TaxID=3162458 RepID=A0ABV2BTU3_9GAMM